MNFRLLSNEDLQRYNGFAKDSCQLTKCSAQALKASSQVVSLHWSKSSTKDEGNKLVKGLDGQLTYYFPVQPFKSEKSCKNPQSWCGQKSGCTVTNPIWTSGSSDIASEQECWKVKKGKLQSLHAKLTHLLHLKPRGPPGVQLDVAAEILHHRCP